MPRVGAATPLFPARVAEAIDTLGIRLPHLPKPWGRVGLIAALLGGGVAAGIWADHHLPYYHFRTVQKGAYYRSSLLSPADLTKVIKDYGIKTIVNLRDVGDREKGDWYVKERAVAAQNGIRFVDVACPGGVPPTPEQVDELLLVWDDPASRPILAHCEKGTLRSAAAEGLWRIEYMGESGPEALSRVTTWGRSLEDDAPKIAAFIKGYVPRRDRATARAPAK